MVNNKKFLPLNNEAMKNIVGGGTVRKLVDKYNVEFDCPQGFIELNPGVKCFVTNQVWDVYNVNIFGKETYSHSETTCD